MPQAVIYYNIIVTAVILTKELVIATDQCTEYQFKSIGVARGGHGRAFALPSLNFALPSKPSF